MGIFAKALKTAVVGGVVGAGSFHLLTRKCFFPEMDQSKDYIFSSSHVTKYNPNRNPFVYDDCARRVKLKYIKPELLEKEGGLVTAFCAGIWGGSGYAIQRRLLAYFFQSDPDKQHQLWEAPDMLASTYPPGTVITDHFNVLENSPAQERIIIRGGEDPCAEGIRPIEGFCELSVEKKLDEAGEEVVDFHFKMVGWLGTLKPDGKPLLPAPLLWLHQQYSKVLVESAVSNVKK